MLEVWKSGYFIETLNWVLTTVDAIPGFSDCCSHSSKSCHHHLHLHPWSSWLNYGLWHLATPSPHPSELARLSTLLQKDGIERKWKKVKLLSRVWLCEPMDCSLPGSSVHGIFQARVLEWVAISFSRGSSQPRDRTWVSHTAGRHLTVWATREAYYINRRPVFPGFLFKGSIKIWSLEPNYII